MLQGPGVAASVLLEGLMCHYSWSMLYSLCAMLSTVTVRSLLAQGFSNTSCKDS